MLTTKKMYDSQLPEWVNQMVASHKLTIAPKALHLLVDHIGNDLSRLQNEVEKLAVNLAGRKNITEDDIEKYIGVSKDFNVFELLTAVAQRNTKRAFFINHHLSGTKEFSIIPLLSQFNSFFMKGVVLKQTQVKDQKGMMALGIGFRQIKDYEKLLANFNMHELENTMALVAEYDLKSKGVNQSTTNDQELMKEFLFRVFYRPGLN
jgi:DNA polymerase-3 subunit delta